jgi:hypothetical protein
MSLFSIVGSDAGVSHLLKVDSDGKLSVKDSVVESSLTSIEAKMDVDNAVFDLMKTKLDEIEVSADALISANHTDLVALESSLSAMEVKQDTQITHLSEIEGAVESLEGCIGSSKVNVNISSVGASTLATEAKQDIMETSLNAIQSAVEGTLSVSAPAVSTTSSVLKNAVSVVSGNTETSSSVDLNDVKSMSVFGSLDDTTGFIVVEVSHDDSTFYEKSDVSVYINSNNHFNQEINVSARYIRFKYSNSSGSAKTWSLISSYKK